MRFLSSLLPATGVVLLLCTSSVVAAEVAADWPQWRGPSRDGKVQGPPWPATLQGDALKPLWRVELGPSYSGPIVTADRVFVTETRDKKEETVRALDRRSGKELWKVSWPGALSVPFFAAKNGSWIRATPAWDGQYLYVAGMRDLLVCIDGATGQIRWRIDFMELFKSPLPSFGFVSSPLVVGPHIYVQAGASVVKLDKATGAVVWRAMQDDGGMWGSAFSSPVIAAIAGVEQLLVQSRTRLAGLSLETGAVLWSRPIPSFRGMNILTPTVVGEQVFTSSYGGGSFAYNMQKDGDGWAVVPAWSNKTEGYMCSPIVIDGHAYLLLRSQRFTCIDLKDGSSRWTSKPFGEYWSLVNQGDRILALDQRGELLLLRATPEKFDLIDRRTISEDSTWAHLALSGNELFIRELGALAVYRWQAVAVAGQ